MDSLLADIINNDIRRENGDKDLEARYETLNRQIDDLGFTVNQLVDTVNKLQREIR